MHSTKQAIEQEQYRVALLLPSTPVIFVREGQASPRLPRVSIPKWTRPAEQITRAIRQEWNAASIAIDFLPSKAERPPCVVAELVKSNGKASPTDLIPIHIDVIDADELTGAERRDIRNILERNTGGRGPFSRLGWVAEAQQWIRTSVRDHSVEFSEDIRQFNASARSALVRFGTQRGPAYWFKAVGRPNEREFTITKTLSKYFPKYLPPLVAAREDWNAWVTEDAGVSLGDVNDLHAFQQATHCLAELQKSSVEVIGRLLANGFMDQRLHILAAHISELIGYLEVAMKAQISTKVEPIRTGRLRELRSLLEDGLMELNAIGIPDTLIHNDVNSGNILFDGARAVFTDWAEGYIGNPFLTFQHLRIHAECEDTTHTWGPLLTAIYKDHWCTLLTERQVERSLALVPPLAIASYLCGRDIGFTASYRDNPQAQSYARSLARHMNHATQAPDFLEALCR